MSDDATTTKLTRDELIQRLQEILASDEGTGSKHVDADDALVDYIGDVEIADLYHRIPKWFA